MNAPLSKKKQTTRLFNANKSIRIVITFKFSTLTLTFASILLNKFVLFAILDHKTRKRQLHASYKSQKDSIHHPKNVSSTFLTISLFYNILDSFYDATTWIS